VALIENGADFVVQLLLALMFLTPDLSSPGFPVLLDDLLLLVRFVQRGDCPVQFGLGPQYRGRLLFLGGDEILLHPSQVAEMDSKLNQAVGFYAALRCDEHFLQESLRLSAASKDRFMSAAQFDLSVQKLRSSSSHQASGFPLDPGTELQHTCEPVR